VVVVFTVVWPLTKPPLVVGRVEGVGATEAEAEGVGEEVTKPAGVGVGVTGAR